MAQWYLPAMQADLGLIPGLGRSPGEGHGNPLQYSCLENFQDTGVWQATVHGVKESDTTERLSTHACMRYGRRKQIPSLERIRFLGCRAGWAQLFMRNGGFSPSRLWKRISLAVRRPGWCGRKVCLCTSSCTETALQERQIKQCLKENTVTVKYEKKTKAASPGTCQTHPDLLVVRITRWFSWALEWPWD